MNIIKNIDSTEVVFDFEKINPKLLPELQGLKEKQLQIVAENPFVEISDNSSYDKAKKARTTFVSARTDIEKQDKYLASKLKKLREAIADASQELIVITKPHEEKQQDEVKRYESVKEAEKAEKERLEAERIANIKNSIQAIYNNEIRKIESLTFETINSLKEDWENNLFKMNVEEFEEFELDFNEKLALLKNQFLAKQKTLEEKEEQRLENERLKVEREKLEADKKAEENRLKAEREKFEKEQREANEKLEAEKSKAEAERLAKDAEAKKIREAEESRLQKEREELETEKAKLKKIEDDRIAKEKAEREFQEMTDRLEKEKAEIEAKAKAETERLKALKPDKEKATNYLSSFKFSDDFPEFKDMEIKQKFGRLLRTVDLYIEEAIKEINNFK